jgi:hypothetical protein
VQKRHSSVVDVRNSPSVGSAAKSLPATPRAGRASRIRGAGDPAEAGRERELLRAGPLLVKFLTLYPKTGVFGSPGGSCRACSVLEGVAGRALLHEIHKHPSLSRLNLLLR